MNGPKIAEFNWSPKSYHFLSWVILEIAGNFQKLYCYMQVSARDALKIDPDQSHDRLILIPASVVSQCWGQGRNMASKRSAVKYVVVDWGHWGIDAQPAGKLILEGEVSEGGPCKLQGLDPRTKKPTLLGEGKVVGAFGEYNPTPTVFFYHSLWSSFSQYYVVADSKAITSFSEKTQFVVRRISLFEGGAFNYRRTGSDVEFAKIHDIAWTHYWFMLGPGLQIQARLSDAPYQLMFPYQRLDTKKRANFETICIQTRQ